MVCICILYMCKMVYLNMYLILTSNVVIYFCIKLPTLQRKQNSPPTLPTTYRNGVGANVKIQIKQHTYFTNNLS